MERCGCGKVHSPFSARVLAPAKGLHIGCGNHVLPNWWNTDLVPYSSHVMGMDATGRFPFPDESFDRVYSEHMIEHVPLEGGRFRRVEVTAGKMLPGNVKEINSGIQPGAHVVANALVLQNTAEQ